MSFVVCYQVESEFVITGDLLKIELTENVMEEKELSIFKYKLLFSEKIEDTIETQIRLWNFLEGYEKDGFVKNIKADIIQRYLRDTTSVVSSVVSPISDVVSPSSEVSDIENKIQESPVEHNKASRSKQKQYNRTFRDYFQDKQRIKCVYKEDKNKGIEKSEIGIYSEEREAIEWNNKFYTSMNQFVLSVFNNFKKEDNVNTISSVNGWEKCLQEVENKWITIDRLPLNKEKKSKKTRKVVESKSDESKFDVISSYTPYATPSSSLSPSPVIQNSASLSSSIASSIVSIVSSPISSIVGIYQ